MARIFISYSRKDEIFARKLAAELERYGADVWVDVSDIPPGHKWSSAIQEGLDSSDTMLVIISPDSMASENVTDEWQYFLDRKRLVVPVLGRPSSIPHYQLNRLQYIDFHAQPFEQAFRQLHGALRAQGTALLPLSEEDTGPEFLPPGRRISRVYWVVAALAAILVVVFIVVALTRTDYDKKSSATTTGPPEIAAAQLSSSETPDNAATLQLSRTPTLDSGDAVVEPLAATMTATTERQPATVTVTNTPPLSTIPSSTATATSTATRVASHTPTLPATQTPMPSDTLTPISTPTATLAPTQTPAATIAATDVPTLVPPPPITVDNAGEVTQVARLQFDGLAAPGAAWSPDGSTLAVLSSGALQIFSVGDWDTPLRRIDYHLNARSMTWSPDSTRLAFGTYDNTVVILDVTSGATVRTLEGHTDLIESVAWAPDGSLLASAGSSSDRTIRLWDVVTGQQVRLLEGHTTGVSEIAWSPDGTRLATVGDDLRVWDVATGQVLYVMSDFYYDPECVAWSPEGSRLAFGSYEGVFVWDATSGQRLYSLPPDGGAVNTVAFSPDGAILAYGGMDRVVHLTDAQSGDKLIALAKHSGWITRISWSTDGSQVASSSKDNTVRIWAVPVVGGLGPTPLPSLPPVRTPAESLSMSTVTAAITANTATGLVEVARLQRDWTWVEGIAWSPDSTLLAVANSQHVWLYTASDFSAEPRDVQHSYWVGVNAMTWSPDGALWAFGDSQDEIHLLVAESGAERATLRGHNDFVEDVAFSPDGALLASAGSSQDRTVRVWDVVTGQQVRLLEGHTGGVAGVAWSPDGKRLVSGGGHELRVWDMTDGQTVLVMTDFQYGPDCVAWSPDGSRLASGSYDGVHVWNAVTGQKLFSLPSDGDAVGVVAFSSDGALLAYGGQDTIVHVMTVETGQEIVALTKHTDWVEAIRWSPDGTLLASAAKDGTVRVWGLVQ